MDQQLKGGGTKYKGSMLPILGGNKKKITIENNGPPVQLQ